MENSTKIIMLAVAIIIVVVIISFTMNIVNIGKDTFNSSNEQLVDNISQMASSQYDVYNNTSQTGEGVIRMINTTFDDVNVEVLVCTKDGYNMVYNKEGQNIYGLKAASNGNAQTAAYGQTYNLDTDPSAAEALSNIAPKDAKGNDFSDTSTSGAKVQLAPVKGNQIAKSATSPGASGDHEPVATSNGYNVVAPMGTPGYITTASYFTCTVQKDINNQVRRITYVQQ